MDLKATISADLKSAMKAQAVLKVSVLRMLTSEIKRREIDKKSPLAEPEIHKTISSMIKQRNESIEAFTKGNRMDLADKEKQEIEILKTYMPADLPLAEVEALIAAVIEEIGATGPADLGKVMKNAVAKAAGRADGKTINEIARTQLTKK